MSAPSLRRGLADARRAQHVIAGVWAGRLLIVASVAVPVALGFSRLSDGAVDASSPRDGIVLEALVRFGLDLMAHPAPTLTVLLLAVLAAGVWNLLWEGGLAAVWQAGRRPGFRSALSAGWALLPALVRLAVAGLAGQISAVAIGTLAGAPLLQVAHRGAWWVEPAVLGVRAAIVAGAWLLAFAALQRARWDVVKGAGAVRSLLRAVRELLRTPVRGSLTALAYVAWLTLLGVVWAVARLYGSAASGLAVAVEATLLAAIVLIQVWSRTVLVLAYRPASDEWRAEEALSPPERAPWSARASAPAA